jgi:hypothetical protein
MRRQSHIFVSSGGDDIVFVHAIHRGLAEAEGGYDLLHSKATFAHFFSR